MKKAVYLFVAIALLASCKNETKTAGAKKDSLVMPYKMAYTSDFTLSDSAKYLQTVLQSYKDWENNNLKNSSALFTDTVAMDFSGGGHLKLKLDSMVKFWQKSRDSLSSVKIEMQAALNLHTATQKADWVSVWYKEIDTYKSGKVDSNYYQDDNAIVNGKIAIVDSKKRVLK